MTDVVHVTYGDEAARDNKKRRRPSRGAALLLSLAGVGAGLGLATMAPASAATWIGGVHFTHECGKEAACWALFNSGPTSNEYNRMLSDCKAMGGTSITKAGSGTVVVNNQTHTYSVTWDYSCWS